MNKPEFTKKEFVKRIENAYDMGLLTPQVLRILSNWTDMVMRLEGGQDHTVVRFLLDEAQRLDNFASNKTLANDRDGYKVIQLAAILLHPCQRCASDPKAWHTRFAFCEHKDEAVIAKNLNFSLADYPEHAKVTKGDTIALVINEEKKLYTVTKVAQGRVSVKEIKEKKNHAD